MVPGIITSLVLVTALVVIFSIGYHPFLIFLLLFPFSYLAGMYWSRRSGSRTVKRTAQKLENEFVHELLRDMIVIDSRIWQEENYNSFFRALSIILSAARRRITLYDRQYSEIVQGSPYAEDLLRQFREQGITAIEPLQVSPEEAADEPLAVKLLTGAAKTYRNVTFVSDDKDLIARARKALKQKKTGITTVDYLQSFLPLCRHYVAAVKAGTIIPLSKNRAFVLEK